MSNTEKQVPYPNHFKDVMSLARENLAAAAVYIHDNGFKKLKNDPLAPRRGPFGIFGKKPFNPTPAEAIEIYHDNKKERYALTAVIAKGVIERAIASRPQRPPYGLVGHPFIFGTQEQDMEKPLRIVPWLGLPDPFRALYSNMLTTIALAHAEEMDYLDEYSTENPKDKLSMTYLRLKQWENFYNNYLPKNEAGGVDLGEDYGTTFNPVFSQSPTGVETGALVMSSTLRVIPQICERDVICNEITPQFLTQTAKNSMPFIAKMTMLSFDTINEILEVLSDGHHKEKLWLRGLNTHNYPNGYFNPDHFTSVRTSQGYRIDLNDKIWEEVEYLVNQTKGSGQKVNLGCPVVPKIDGNSALRSLWDWHVDIGERIFTDYWSSRFEPAAIKEDRFQTRKAMADTLGLVVPGIHF